MVWAKDASDTEVAVTVREAFSVARSNKRDLRTACLVLDARGQISPPGGCPRGPTQKDPEPGAVRAPK